MGAAKRTLVGLTQGRHQPSTRFRWAQYTSDLQDAGFEVNELGSHFGAYAPVSKFQRPAWLAASIVENAQRILRANNYDIRFLQRNLTATLCTWEPLLKKPFVFDVDDAIFLGARGNGANRIASEASIVICGNDFLASHFEKFAPVTVLPTAIDSVRFSPDATRQISHPQVIGWSGSSSGLKYVYAIEPAIKEVLSRHPDSVLKIVSDQEPIFKSLPHDRVLFEKWTAIREVEVLREFTLGIMPLEDDLWARGKCSFKMLTYMSVGLPVVASPVGMNKDLLSETNCGYGPRSHDEWISAISALLRNDSLAKVMGRAGRSLVEKSYSRVVLAPKLVDLLMSVV
jgi:glycosyltransferase involved in cell wall biosynthesis